MGQFDIGNKYNEDCSVSWHSFYMDLVQEFETSHPCEFIDEDTIRDKFTNNDGSGLVDKLKAILNFDIKDIAGEVNSERFDMFKILKLLFYIEKYGAPKTEVASKNYRIQITDILAKPRLSNVPSEYTGYSVYGEVFNRLYSSIKNVVKDAAEREVRLEKINAYWEYITEKIFDYVINDRALEHPEEALKELERINVFLKEKVLNKLQNCNAVKRSKPEKVLPAFFNLLACHKLLCNETDRIRINYEICIILPSDAQYIENFKKYERCQAKWEILPLIKERLAKKDEASDAVVLQIKRCFILHFILVGFTLASESISDYFKLFLHIIYTENPSRKLIGRGI